MKGHTHSTYNRCSGWLARSCSDFDRPCCMTSHL